MGEPHYDAKRRKSSSGRGLHESIPALGGKTPRQAARSQAGREMLNGLLADFE